MGEALFDLKDFEPKFSPDMYGCAIHELHRAENEHVADCWHNSCPSCGDPVRSGSDMRLNHYGADYGLCISLQLRLAHIVYDLRQGRAPADRDLTVLDLGWRFGPDGSALSDGYKRPAPECGRVICGSRIG